MVESESLNVLLKDLRGALNFQAELGLCALEVSKETLKARNPKAKNSDSPFGAAKVAQNPSHARAIIHSALAGNPPTNPSKAPRESLSQLPLAGGLEAIRTELGDCQRCGLAGGRTNIVFGVGSSDARLMFIGEGPGRDEDLQGEPFVGKAGQLLTKMIGAMGLKRADVYIANIVKCRPPRNRDPEPQEVESCEPFLRKQIEVVRPEVIVTLGKYASQTILRDDTAISRLRGNWRDYQGVAVMPTFHPAYLLRDAKQKKPVWQDLQAVMKRLGLSAPPRT